MTHQYAKLTFTARVRALQSQAGSREAYAAMDEGPLANHRLTEREIDFIHARDSFYMATVNEHGWPYVQHRGGPAGFLKVIDSTTLGFADYRGNRQYLSAGNLLGNDRVSLFLMDYPNRRRLKLLGRVRQVGFEDEATLAALEDANYPAQVERAMIISVEAFDWNCPQHITPRFSSGEIESLGFSRSPLHRSETDHSGTAPRQPTGTGPLAVNITGMRQLTPRIRSFELRKSGGGPLPEVGAGAHLSLPVRLASGELVDRQYSIASDPRDRGTWEIAVLRESAGEGGSLAIHESWQLGMELRTPLPENQFKLDLSADHTLLIAGGIGITPIRSMAHELMRSGRSFTLHYAGRAPAEMAFVEDLRTLVGNRLITWARTEGRRMPVAEIIDPAAQIYTCGPASLINEVRKVGAAKDLPRSRLHFESFS